MTSSSQLGAATLPTGTVTFLFTDIEGSTRLLGQLGDRYRDLLETHHRILRHAVGEAGGVVFGTEGDAFFVVFTTAPDAVRGAVEAQRALMASPWPPDGQVRVRMGLHTGGGELGGESYVGMDVHRAARIAATGYGGQIVVSDATRTLAEGSGSIPGITFRDLGEHRLKDLPQPVHLFQVLAAGLDTEFPPLRTLDTRPGNLPTQLTTFVGRGKEIEEIKEALQRSRLITLTGPGGTGKTRLSLQVAREAQSAFPDGAYFVALAPIREPELVATATGKALGLRQEPDRPPIETVIDHLQDKRTLLVLDNFEQVMDAAPDVARILEAAERARVIVTSRESLRIHGEQEYPVPPLTLPDPHDLPPLDALSHFEAVALFIERARAVKPGFEVTNENAPAVAEICARLDGLPLAIELAAARVKLLTPEAILGRLESRLTLLAGGARDLPARQQTLRDAIGWSYDLLDERERHLFARLSAFAGGFTLEAVDAVCTEGLGVDALEGVASLLNKSLLRQSQAPGREGRFFMLETIREFAAERLAESEDGDEVHGRHASYFLRVVEEEAPELFGPKQAELLDALEIEHDNFRVALTWAATGDLPTALRMGGALWRFWQMRGFLLEGADRLGRLVEMPEAASHPQDLAIALEGAGGVAYWIGAWDEARRHYARCLEIRQGLEDPAAVAEALYNLSFTYGVPPPPRRDIEEGRRLMKEAMDIYRDLDDRRGLARTLWGMAAMSQVTNEWSRSAEEAAQVVPLFLELDDRFGAAWAYHALGLSSVLIGQLEEAGTALSEGLQIFMAAGDVTGVGLLLQDISLLRASQGDHERAARLRGAALEFERRSGQALVTNMESNIPDLEDRVRGPLPAEEYDRLLEEGAAMTMEEAAAYGLHRSRE